MDGFRWKLAARPAVAAAMADPELAGAVNDRVTGWLTGRGYAPEGVAVLGDGTVLVDCDRDPGPEWGAFDPAVKTAAETKATTERDQVRAMLTKLDAGIATPLQLQRAVAWLARRVLATEREG